MNKAVSVEEVRKEMVNRGMVEEAEICFGDSWSPVTWDIIQKADRIVLEAESIENAVDLIETAFNQEALQGGIV